MRPMEAVNALVDKGYSQPEIVSMVKKKGISTTQGTISRIRTGAFKSVNYELGNCIIQIYKENKRKKAKK